LALFARALQPIFQRSFREAAHHRYFRAEPAISAALEQKHELLTSSALQTPNGTLHLA